MLQSVARSVVRTELRVEIAQDSDANNVTHAVIVLERVAASPDLLIASGCDCVEPLKQVLNAEQNVEAKQS